MPSAEEANQIKSDGRDSRLTFKNHAESSLRRDLKEESLDKCKPQVKNFAICAEEKGLLVVMSCRKQLRELNKCMELYNSEEAFQAYKEKHSDVLERKSNPNAPGAKF
jgi:hypothetical protein